MNLERPHHRAIWRILQALDNQFLQENNILFGGGTRIAMELGEYRESVDLDLFCVGRGAYRAARSSIHSQTSFGSLFREGRAPNLYGGREIRADRDAIRSILEADGKPIKFELIHFDSDEIVADHRTELFPVPCVSQESCFVTKLLANADRYRDTCKDIIDLCMMYKEWGGVPSAAWQTAFSQYGEKVIMQGLEQSLEALINEVPQAIEVLVEDFQMAPGTAQTLVNETAVAWHRTLSSNAG